ncbi:MAG: Calx-beta domain-containing protein, partial [Actinomycetota bacterium]
SGDCDFEISRWKADGSVDPTFDADGESTTRIGTFDLAHAVVVQPDGKTVAAGVTQTGGLSRIAVTRYTGEDGPSPGNLDKSFGTGGVVTSEAGAGAEAWGLALQSDGRLLVGGTTVSGATRSFVLLRYEADGELDGTFGNGGSAVTSFPGRNADGHAIAVAPDGRWLVAGMAASGGNADLALARYVGQLSGRVLVASDAAGDEEHGSLTFTVHLASSDGQPVSVRYATADGTATAPEDYTSASGTLTFGPGETTKTVRVEVRADGAGEPDETVLLHLTNPSPADTVLVRSQLVGTISDTGPIISENFPAGYRLVASDGGIFAFGLAGFLGSTGDIRLNQPIVAMANTPSGNGYWLLASDGGIFAFGDAGFHGSTGNIRLARPIVGMAPTPSGNGYWLVASDGGIFAVGDASYVGSTGTTRLARPIVGMAPTSTGAGYWMVASDGGMFAFGDATFHGSTGALTLAKPIVGMAATATGRGYWLAATDGGIFAFGDAAFAGSSGNIRLTRPIVGIAAP